jgi:integrase
LLSAINTAGRIIGKPLAAIRADDLPGLSAALYARHHAAHGMGKRRFHNVITGLRAALRLAALHAPFANQRREKLPAAWQDLVAAVSGHGQRSCLTGFARWCDARGLTPQDVLDSTLASYASEMAASKISAAGSSLARKVARAWLGAVRVAPDPAEGPFPRLTAPARRQAYAVQLQDLSSSFCQDLQRFQAALSGNASAILQQIREGNAPRLGTRPRREATIKARVFAIRQAAGLLAINGTVLGKLTSLRDLVQPLERVEIVLKSLAQRRKLPDDSGEALRGSHLAQVAATLLQVGKFVGLAEQELQTLREFNAAVSIRDRGMSPKSYQRMSELAQPRARAILLNLPQELLRRAKLEDPTSKDAARLALLAAAIELLLVVPVRCGTLLSLELNRSVIRSGSRRAPVIHLQIRGAHTKNGNYIPRRLPEMTTKILGEYIDFFRPQIAAPNNYALFPSADGLGRRSNSGIAQAIGKEVEAATGVRCSIHIFRHLAAEAYLRHRPGAFDEFRHILGNRCAESTHRHYAVLEASAAAERFDQLILRERTQTKLLSLASRQSVASKKVRRNG